jgi:hypothetical protein
LIHFLDRFVYKNPKQISEKDEGKKVKGHHGSSLMQPKPYQSTLLRKTLPMDRSMSAPVTSKEWRDQAGVEDSKIANLYIPVDEQFYATFFRNK